MLFNSLEFLMFLLVVFALYHTVLKGRLMLQNCFLLVVSYFFYGYWDWRFLVLIFLATFIDFFVAIGIDRETRRTRKRIILAISIVCNLGMLIYFKYADFFVDSFASLLSNLGLSANHSSLQVILPVGISFYTFQTMSYTIDVYRGKIRATRDIVAFFAYVSFFPQLVAGPIERAVNLLPQFLRQRVFTYANGVQGLRYMLWGFFKKVVVADNCALFVNSVFADYHHASSDQLVMAVFLFAFQIYGDFSGYSDIAIGTAKLFGFQLTRNFNLPYFSRDIAEFWRRWHISLTAWFKDYVYIPLGGNRMGKRRTVINVLLVFLLSGLWHGANWTFVVWGLINAVFFIPQLVFNWKQEPVALLDNRASYSWMDWLRVLATFAIVCLGWLFFRAPSLADGMAYIRQIIAGGYGILQLDYTLPLSAVTVLLLLDWRFRKHDVPFAVFDRRPTLRYAVYSVVTLLIIFYGAFMNPQTFIYFQF